MRYRLCLPGPPCGECVLLSHCPSCLRRWPKTVIIVSHARQFLNETCTDIVHLKSKKLTTYRGTYDNFEKQLYEHIRNQRSQAEGIERQKKHIQVWKLPSGHIVVASNDMEMLCAP